VLDPVDRLRLSAIRMSGMKAQRHEVATPPRFALTARFATSMLYILKSLQPNSGWRGAPSGPEPTRLAARLGDTVSTTASALSCEEVWVVWLMHDEFQTWTRLAV
jgi:hypothetical protein